MKRSILLIAASLIAFGGISGAQAYDKGHLQAIKSGQKECPKCDLAGADLKGADLTKVNLKGADLTGAVLSRARFEGANLSGAIFKSARLDEVDLTKVDLKNVNLDKAWCGLNTKLPAGSGWSCVGVILTRK